MVLFDDECRTKPLRVISDVSPDPFTRPLSERPNEGKCSLWQNPDIGLTSGAVHGLWSVLANSDSGLIGNSGRRRANVCDKHAKETTRNTVTAFTGFAFIILLRKSRGKVPQDVVKAGE